MPLPKNDGGDKDKFVARCMSNTIVQKEFPDRKQRLAVCMSRACDGIDKIIASDIQHAVAKFGYEERVTDEIFNLPRTYLSHNHSTLSASYKYENPKTGEIYYFSRKGSYKRDGVYLVFVSRGEDISLYNPFVMSDTKPYGVFILGEDDQLNLLCCDASQNSHSDSKSDLHFWCNELFFLNKRSDK